MKYLCGNKVEEEEELIGEKGFKILHKINENARLM
jgi:hypothetical protein